jgi:hypothetical protein
LAVSPTEPFACEGTPLLLRAKIAAVEIATAKIATAEIAAAKTAAAKTAAAKINDPAHAAEETLSSSESPHTATLHLINSKKKKKKTFQVCITVIPLFPFSFFFSLDQSARTDSVLFFFSF